MCDTDPDYIQYLLCPNTVHDCYFLVGNKALGPVERIGVVKKMLLAHSKVLRMKMHNNWQPRDTNGKETVKVTGIFPRTFRNLLRFVYGFDTTASMVFDDANHLLFVAHKYMMGVLKKKLAARLVHLLDYSNVCKLLTNPACFTVLELDSEITKILECETDRVFSTAQFLSCSSEIFVKILEQEVMNVPELEVWRAAVKWAKHKAQQNESTESLRKELENPLKHIRVCTLPYMDFCQEVVPTGILSGEEVTAICVALVTKQRPLTLQEVCSEMRVRETDSTQKPISLKKKQLSELDDGGKVIVKETEFSRNQQEEFIGNQSVSVNTRYAVKIRKPFIVRNKSVEKRADIGSSFDSSEQSHSLCFELKTHQLGVEITKLELICKCFSTDTVYNFWVKVTPVNDPDSVSILNRTGVIDGFGVFIPFSTADTELLLLPETEYNINISCDTDILVWRQEVSHDEREFFTVKFHKCGDAYVNPVYQIYYRTLTSEPQEEVIYVDEEQPMVIDLT